MAAIAAERIVRHLGAGFVHSETAAELGEARLGRGLG